MWSFVEDLALTGLSDDGCNEADWKSNFQGRNRRRKPMNTTVRALMLSTASVTALAMGAAPAGAKGASCASLASLSLPETTIVSAASYAAGATITGTTTAPVAVCRV